MRTLSQLKITLFVLLITLCGSTPSIAKEAHYSRWVDSNGVTHYGSRPPAGVKSVLIKTKTPNTESVEAGESDQSVPTETTKSLLAQHEQQCKEQRERLATLKTPNLLIGVKLDDGTTKYLTPEEIASDIAATELFIEKACQTPD